MKISVNLNYNLLKDDDRFLNYVSEAGFDGIDFGINHCWSDEERTDFLKECEELKKRLEKYNLECLQAHLPCYDMMLSSEIFDEQTDKNVVCAFDAMKILGCEWGAYHPRCSFNFKYDTDRAHEDNKKLLSIYLEDAVKRGVKIAVENLPVFPDCPQYRFFTADYDDHIKLVDSLNSESIGVCWDFGHANLMGYDMRKVLKKMGERIKIIHVHNNFRTGDHHLPPSMGTIDWDEIIPALKSSGFKGNMSLEVNSSILPETQQSFYRHCADSAKVLVQKFEEC